MPDAEDFKLESYQYDLDEKLIAQHPCSERSESRLMVLDRQNTTVSLSSFSRLAEHLEPGSLLMVNDTKVLPARINGHKDTGGKVEFLLLTPLPLIKPQESGYEKSAEVECLLKASKRPKIGQKIFFAHGVSFTVLQNLSMGRTKGRLFWTGDLASYFVDCGHVPLPPYIQRPDSHVDADRYQTVYSSNSKLGSVAAPTAGLHFTPGFKDSLIKAGYEWAAVTLYVGYGTFSPVRSSDIRQHKMHPEYIEVSAASAQAVKRARHEGRKVVAVGTTTVRTIESASAQLTNGQGFQGWTDLFIYPGYKFQVVDQLITNFHLPGSSLIMMISALAGREMVMGAYARARDEGFRFYSYGDAMLII